MRHFAVIAAVLVLVLAVVTAEEARLYKTTVEDSLDLLEAGVASPRFHLHRDDDDSSAVAGATANTTDAADVERRDNSTIPRRRRHRGRGRGRHGRRGRGRGRQDRRGRNETARHRNGTVITDDKYHELRDGEHYLTPAERVNNDGDPELLRSKLDDRKYANMTLENGLQVLLISDPESPKAAASMDVGVGYFNDPAGVAGLAHFLEHMLFLGSKKYPRENEFETYIQKHGGSNNAYTSMENTNFYFDILPTDLEGGLDRFAQFFVSPVLGIDNAKREMNAVNSEHRKNIESDGWRSTQIKRHVASPASPYSKFGTGSIETLGAHSMEALQGHLRALWERYYTAANMRLVVLGAHSLRELAQWVESSFGKVRPTPVGFPVIGRDRYAPDEHKQVYDANMKKSIVFYTPVRRIRSVTLQWAIPSQAYNYSTNAGGYVGHLIEADGDGTLQSHLRKKGWITGIQAGVGVTTSTFSLFQVEVSLTSRGMRYVNEITEAVFQTIHRIKKRGLSRWRFTELARVARIQYGWKGKERPMSLVSDISARMRWYNKKHWLSGSNLYYGFDRTILDKLLFALTPANVVIFQSSRSLATSHNLDRTEPHYGIKFTVAPVAPEVVNIWERETERNYLFGDRNSNKLRLPEPNKWIPGPEALKTKPFFDLRTGNYVTDVSVNSSIHIAPPMVIYENERPAARIWYRQDAKFKRPIVHANIRIWVNNLQNTPRNAALTLMYTQLVQDQLHEWAYAASYAGYDYSIHADREGLTLTLVGYPENLESYFKSIAYRMSIDGFRPNDDRFTVLRRRTLESLANTKYQAPYKYARSLVRLALGESHPISDLAAQLNIITFKDIRSFPKAIFSDCRVEAFFNGNLLPWEARAFAEAARTALNYETTSTSFKEAHRHIQQWKSRRPLLDGRYTIATNSLNQNEQNSMTYALFQAGPGGAIDRLYMQILDRYLHKPAYNVLRTQEQLGYIVWAIGATTNDVQELVLQVQSTTFAPNYVNARIQTFLARFRERLHNKVNPREFAGHVMTLYESKLTNSTTLTDDTKAFWGSILSQRYNFMQRFVDAQLLLKKVTLGGFLKFVDRVLGYGKYSGASLVLEVAANGKGGKPVDPAPARFPAHQALPDPLPSNDYTDRLRRIAALRVTESLQREGKLSDYLRTDKKFRYSAEGRKVLEELLNRRAMREVLKRNLLEHMEHNSLRKLKNTHGYQSHEHNCTLKCAKVQNETMRPVCITNCVTRVMNEENLRSIATRRDECVGRCQKIAAAMGVNQAANVTANCTATCDTEARYAVSQANSENRKKADQEEKIKQEKKKREEEARAERERRELHESFVESSESSDAYLEDAAASGKDALFNAVYDINDHIVSDEKNPAAVLDAALAARSQVKSYRLADMSAFLETETQVSRPAELEAELDIESAADLEADEAAESFVDSMSTVDSEGERQAAVHLSDKVALLDALEAEAFEAGMALRRQAEAAAASSRSLVEAVPTTMYKEEGEKAYSRMGFDKFEKIADPTQEMEEYGRPKQAVEDISDRVFQRYANVSQIDTTFQYDGSDTDVPVTMTIKFSPYATKQRQLSTAMLSSLRHTLFLAPLRVKENVPLLVPVPESAPADAKTIPKLL